MGSVVPSCCMDLDATIYQSYVSGQTWASLEGSPADGSSQTAYDVYLGANSSATVTDPTFTGSAGDAAAYFSYDGGDYNVIPANTTFIEDWHDTTAAQDFTVLIAMSYVTGTGQGIATTKIAGASIGVLMYTNASNNMLMTQRGATAGVTVTSTTTIPSGNCFIGYGHSHGTNTTAFWANTTTAETFSHTFNTTTAAANNPLTLFAYNNATNIVLNGTKVYAVAIFNEYLTNAQVDKVVKHWSIRHNRQYV